MVAAEEKGRVGTMEGMYRLKSRHHHHHHASLLQLTNATCAHKITYGYATADGESSGRRDWKSRSFNYSFSYTST